MITKPFATEGTEVTQSFTETPSRYFRAMATRSPKHEFLRTGRIAP